MGIGWAVSALIVVGFSLAGILLVATGSKQTRDGNVPSMPDGAPPKSLGIAKALGVSALIIIGFSLGGLVLAVVAFDVFTHGYLHLMVLGFPYPWIIAKPPMRFPYPTLFTFGMLQFLVYGVVFEGTHRLFKISRWWGCIPVLVLHVGAFFFLE